MEKYDSSKLQLSDRWILSRLARVNRETANRYENYALGDAAKGLYEFVWNDFCDWYLEIAKIRFYSGNEEQGDLARTICLKCIQSILALLHPYAPFITEELWSQFKDKDSKDLIRARHSFQFDL